MSLYKCFFTMFFATLLVTFALHVHAEEKQGSPINVRGLVVSSGHALIINDGVRDYILLGVDNSDYEGKICEIFGEIRLIDEMSAIDVRTITIIANEYPDDDLVGENRGLGSPCQKLHCADMRLTGSVSSGLSMDTQRNLSLPIWDGNGMRFLGVETETIVGPHAVSDTLQLSRQHYG